MQGSLLQHISDITIQSVHKVTWTRAVAPSGDTSATNTYSSCSVYVCVCVCKWVCENARVFVCVCVYVCECVYVSVSYNREQSTLAKIQN